MIAAIPRVAAALALASHVLVAPLSPSDECDPSHPLPPHASSLMTASTRTRTSSGGLAGGIAAVFPRQFDTANDIPDDLFRKKTSIKGRVLKVIDGDTIRVRHTPFYPLSSSGGCGERKLTECTISVRLYGVDAPETAKFGNPGQPYSQEAKDFVTRSVKDRVVTVKLLGRDRYSRVIGRVKFRNRVLPLGVDLTQSLASHGYASLYTGGGAQYDGERERLEMLIEQAQSRRKGIWSDGVDNFADPAKYKREMRAKKNR